MAISYVGVTPFNSLAGPSYTCAVPAGVVDGDLLLAFHESVGNAVSPPTGWTALIASTAVGAPIGWVGVYYRVAASEPASYVFTGNSYVGAIIVAYRGAATTAPGCHSTTVRATTVEDTITTTVATSWVVNFGVHQYGTPTQFANDTSRGLSFDPNGIWGLVGDRAPGSVGPSSSGSANAVSINPWFAASVEVAPPAAGNPIAMLV